ncbi:hypothetical protein SAMN06298226_1061 [Nitrosovibrio sp. Nv4]|nr:hypothetical protein SAMN06298226_1061 [Nitrosovibrio sp. Nv4]
MVVGSDWRETGTLEAFFSLLTAIIALVPLEWSIKRSLSSSYWFFYLKRAETGPENVGITGIVCCFHRQTTKCVRESLTLHRYFALNWATVAFFAILALG